VTGEFSDLSVDAIRAAVREVLGDAKYRENAQRMEREVRALPAPSDVVALLERLAAEQRPYAEPLAAQV
jgi:UDP:flavonoid glycosyltransferase YjiC (YdhE family)